MEPLTIEGDTTLFVEGDGGAFVFLRLMYKEDGNWEHVFLDYGEVKQLAEWLTEWMKENEDKKDE